MSLLKCVTSIDENRVLNVLCVTEGSIQSFMVDTSEIIDAGIELSTGYNGTSTISLKFMHTNIYVQLYKDYSEEKFLELICQLIFEYFENLMDYDENQAEVKRKEIYDTLYESVQTSVFKFIVEFELLNLKYLELMNNSNGEEDEKVKTPDNSFRTV